jgi:hypothetical protein
VVLLSVVCDGEADAAVGSKVLSCGWYWYAVVVVQLL